MKKHDSWRFRKCWMFDTHEAIYHLDDKNNIVWIECGKIWDKIIWVQAWRKVWWYIWNPWVFTLSESKNNEIASILTELTQTYPWRIKKWLNSNNKISTKKAA